MPSGCDNDDGFCEIWRHKRLKFHKLFKCNNRELLSIYERVCESLFDFLWSRFTIKTRILLYCMKEIQCDVRNSGLKFIPNYKKRHLYIKVDIFSRSRFDAYF